MATVEGLDTMRVECRTLINHQIRLALGGMPDTTTLVECDLPGSLRMAFAAGEASGLIAVADGKLMIHDPAANRCVVVPAPTERNDIIMEALERGAGAVSQSDVLFLPMMMVGAFEETHTGPKAYEGLETVEGTECHHLSMDTMGTMFHFWVENTEQALPRRVLVVLPEGQIPDTEGEVALFDVRFDGWDLEPTFAEGTFSFTPPEGAEIVETLIPEAPPGPEATLLGAEAPAFELATLDGGTLKLEDLVGKKIIVLDFWATWCMPCVRALPIVSRVTAEFADQGVEFWALNQGEDVETIKTFLAERKLDIQVALDSAHEVGEAYGVEGIPSTVIIDLNGVVQAYHVGFGDDYEETLTAELEALLAGESLVEPAKG
jgi:peroxiredoxin